MKLQNSVLPDVFHWKFLLSLGTALRAVRPRIVEITSISITKIHKVKKDGVYDYRAVVKGKIGTGSKLMLKDADGDSEWTFEHREDCPWMRDGK